MLLVIETPSKQDIGSARLVAECMFFYL